MKKIILLLTALALLVAPAEAFAQNWWSGIGANDAAQTAEPVAEPEVEPTQKPGLSLGNVFGGLLDKDEPQQQEATETELEIIPTPPTEDVSDDVSDDVEDDEEYYEEGDGYLGDALFGYGVQDITSDPYGGSCQYAVVGNWTIAYGNCDDHYCIFGWNEYTREYHILAETIVSDFVPAGDVFAYYGEVSKGKFGWLVRDPNEPNPVSLSLNELNTVFWSDEDYLYYFTYGKGTGTTYHRMDHDGKNKKQLGKLNGRAVAMRPDGSVVVFNASKNRVELFRDGKTETLYDPKDDISNVISTGREIWVAHTDYFGLVNNGALSFQFPGYMISYAATTDQIIGVLDDGSVRLNVVMLNDVYGAYAIVDQVIAQDHIRVEVTPGWYNRIVVWGQRESLEFHTPYTDAWLPYGYYDLESAKAAGYRVMSEHEDEEDYGSLDGYLTGKNEPADEGEQVVRWIPDKLLGESADVFAEAEERGIYVSYERDGNYYYYMDNAQHQALLNDRREGLEGILALVTLGDKPSVVSYEASDDFSRITFRVIGDRVREDGMLMLVLSSLSLSAPAYQCLLREVDNPVCVITLVDNASGKELSVLTAPDDFL